MRPRYLLVLLVAVLQPISAKANAELPARVDFRTEPECPDPSGFFGHLKERLPELKLIGPGEQGYFVRASIEARHASDGAILGYSGTVGFWSAEEKEADRYVEAATCAEVTEALSLIIAIYLREARALQQQEPMKTNEAPLTKGQGLSASVPRPPVASFQSSWLTQASFGARYGIASRLAPELGAAVGLVFQKPHTILSPGVWLRAGYAWGSVDTEDTPATYELISMALEGCPLSFARLYPWLLVDTCLRVEGGSNQGAFEGAEAASAPWVAAGPTLSLEIPLGSFYARMEAFGGLPLSKSRFFGSPSDQAIFETRDVVGSMGIAIGHRLGSAPR